MVKQAVRRIMRKAVKNTAEKNNVTPEKVNVLLSLKEDNDSVRYRTLIEGQGAAETTFPELNGGGDFMGYEDLARPYISATLVGLAKEFEVDPPGVYVSVYLATDGKTVKLYAYADNKPKRAVTLAEIFE